MIKIITENDKMFEKYIGYIEHSDIVDDNKQKLKSF